MSQITELGSSQLTPSDSLTVILSEPDGIPPTVVVHWPARPTAIDPAKFRDTAAALVRLFSEAHVTLAAIKSRRRL
jgi:hypothetical protein